MARILLAEDDAAARDLVQRALGLDGHEVVVTQDGLEALEQLQGAGRIDLLITDVQMPVLDGFETTRRIEPELLRPLEGGLVEIAEEGRPDAAAGGQS